MATDSVGLDFSSTAQTPVEHAACSPSVGCRYHTVQPAPTQWAAIGVTHVTGSDGEVTPRLIVEVGPTEREALGALRSRCAQLSDVRGHSSLASFSVSSTYPRRR